MPEFEVSGRVIREVEEISWIFANSHEEAAELFAEEFEVDGAEVIVDEVECIDTEEACKEVENGGA